MRRRTALNALVLPPSAWPWGPWSVAVASEGLRWFEHGRPGPLAHEAVDLLAAAPEDGLDPLDYAVETLRRELRAAPQAPSAEAAALDALLSAAVTRYLADLRLGRIDPRQVHAEFTPPRRHAYDAAAALDAALRSGRLSAAVREAAPRLSPYQRLREALARYRVLADHPAWRQPLPALPPAAGRASRLPKLEPGQTWSGLALLAQRLQALDDLAPSAPLPARYEGPLVEAVRRFQMRHGLADDGVVGAKTWAQLQVPPRQRVRQIELTLERLRWTPIEQGRRMIAINLPEFMLRAYEVRDGRIEVKMAMKVIVGKAMDTRTPVFDEDMRFIEFSPYWNVPSSIARNELVPRLRRDPAHFQREGFEFVGPGGEVVQGLTAARLDAVLAGTMRIRQRPGPRNALGDIKFVFPNRAAIYLHHTPATSLFARDRRDFSHGCIRVEEPLALAKFVLAGQPEWTEERIRALMEGGESVTLRLEEPLPVLIAYATALVIGGTIRFFEDLYGHDRLLEAALRQPRPPLRPPS